MIRRIVYDVEFRVLVKEKLKAADSVLLTGSCQELGEWIPQKCLTLNRESSSPTEEIWSTNVKIVGTGHTKIYYRYLIAQIVRCDEDMNLIIKKWETFKEPRVIECDKGPKVDGDYNTRTATTSNVTHNIDSTDEFPAIFGTYKGICRIDIGWLTGQTEIQLRFHSNYMHIWSAKLRNNKFSLKVSPIDLSYQQDNEEVSSDLPVQQYSPTSKVFTQSAILRKYCCETSFQSDYGAVVEKDDYLIVKVQTFEPENVAYHIDFYLVDDNTTIRKHVGFAYVLPIHSNQELGDNKHLTRIVPIIGLKHNPIGQIKIDIQLITPLKDIVQKFFVSSSKYWRQGRRVVNVGHRGLGKTNTEHIPSKSQQQQENSKAKNNVGSENVTTGQEHESSNRISFTPPILPTRPVQSHFVSENTLASFKAAFDAGADFVEFDVQLSKDKVPVVYHDFQVAITLKRKEPQAELFLVGVKDLSLPQLQSLKIYHASKHDVPKPEDDLDEDDQNTTLNTNVPVAIQLNDNVLENDIVKINHHPPPQQSEKKFRSLFPTLQELFEQLDPHLGFNVEVKYAMEYKQGGSEQAHYFERNDYIDRILYCLMTYAKKRVIVISTFDPDCASMLRLKQNLFPVLFLTQGEILTYPQFLDVRTWNVDIGLCFVISEHLSGLAAPVVDVIDNSSFVKRVKEKGKLLFIWGDEASSKEVIKTLVELRVDGLIYDRISELQDEPTTIENVFIAEEREELEVFNRLRTQQLEQQHSQLLQELERLKSVRDSNGKLTTDVSTMIDSTKDFKDLISSFDEKAWYIFYAVTTLLTFVVAFLLSRFITLEDAGDEAKARCSNLRNRRHRKIN
ncbi:unnamed protein product [Didymodactylos carnosus]|uniref:GP-PDE domain-containing protein n=1 Tax=Didymodactylos carnosus TaxID=1234261 RepID=A0A813VBU6_9BILA|nr:unnamed protein product [Didymodactylos carnosus]CAF0836014.1 unnamed protein product [Didymodactylos carnosus]CAF3541492.1 unnamed protein product [Didymodactylos carnosus]CAF3623245.1 unnamed protein product [Didymodactylos carnosus]